MYLLPNSNEELGAVEVAEENFATQAKEVEMAYTGDKGLGESVLQVRIGWIRRARWAPLWASG